MSETRRFTKERPYFIWDHDLSEEDVRAILRGDNEYEKVQMMVRIIESARWEDIWKYLNLAEVEQYWPEIRRRLRKELRPTWEWAMEVWNRGSG